MTATPKTTIAAALAASLLGLVACTTEPTLTAAPAQPEPLDEVKVGEFLFKDLRLSSSGKMACVTCHSEEFGHADVPGLRVTRERGRLFFGAQVLPPLGTHVLRPGETVEIPELGLRITVGEPGPFREIHSTFTTFYFKSAIIHDKLSVTPRRPGDRIRLAGRGCTKRVSDLFAERGLTQAERDRVPIIRAADAPAAIAGFGVAEQCAAAPGQTMICIRMEQIQTYGGEYYERYER